MLAVFAIVISALALGTSAISVVIQIMNYRRDRPEIKLSVEHEQEFFEMDGVRGVGETSTLVIVTNTGRRPVTIKRVGARRLFPKGGFVEFVCNPEVPKELTEGKWLSALADEERVDFTEVEAWEAHDAVGNPPYRMNVASRSTRMWSHLRSNWAKWTRVPR
jgi:hypothetical protein